MKKIAALLVAALMLLSILPMAFAQEADDNSGATDSGTGGGADSQEAASTGAEVVMLDDTGAETATEDAAEASTEDAAATSDASADETAVETVVVSPEPAESAEEVVTPAEVEEAGVTPDQPIKWGIERAIERIDLALTFNRAAKAQKGLIHARERLMEVKAMIAEKKLDAAEKAKVQHGKALGKVKQEIEDTDGNEPEQQLEDQVEMENEVEEQERSMENVEKRARDKLQLTPEQEQRIQAIVSELKGDLENAKVKIVANKNKIKIAVQAKTGKTKGEVEEMDRTMRAQVQIKTTGSKVDESGERIQERIKEQSKKKAENKEADVEDKEVESAVNEDREDEDTGEQVQQENDEEDDEEETTIDGTVSIGSTE